MVAARGLGLDPAGPDHASAVLGTSRRSLVVARHGEVIAAHRLRGSQLDRPVNIKSASKTVISALAGIAIGKGVLTGTDQEIAPILKAPFYAFPIHPGDIGTRLIRRGNQPRVHERLAARAGEHLRRPEHRR